MNLGQSCGFKGDLKRNINHLQIMLILFDILSILHNNMKITRLYSDKNGESHFEDIDIPLQDGGEIGRLSDIFPVTGLMLRENPGDYNYDWHPAPLKQYIVMLEGMLEVEVSDGERRRFPPGDILLVEDLEGKGHKSRVPDGRPRKSLFITI
jgi:hypothetical protein